jgi:hypothetical protein
LARRRAHAAVASLRVAPLFPLPSLLPSWRRAARFGACALLAIAVGSYDRGLLQALLAPPTASERAAAVELEQTVTELASQLDATKKETTRERSAARDKTDDRGGQRGPSFSEMAREAARAAKRGDRKGALEKLDGMRTAGAEEAARAGEIGATLRKLAEALGSPPTKTGASEGARANQAASASDSMRLLAKKVRSGEGADGKGEEEDKRTLERLERAGDEARRAAASGKNPDAGEAARALSRAAEALRKGDREAAARELEQAAQRAASMEEQRSAMAAEAMAVAEMLERSGALERAIQMALLGREGSGKSGGKGDGKGDGKGEDGLGLGDERGSGDKGGDGRKGGDGNATAALRAAIMARLAAMGATDPDGDPGTGSGPHIPDRKRARREALVASGSLQAPSQVNEGERAIQALKGLGRGTEPPASYREVFPAYDAAAEEGMADERIPAARRGAVRRYFRSIRPDAR